MIHIDVTLPLWLLLVLVIVVGPACQWAGRKSGDAVADGMAAMWRRLRKRHPAQFR